MFSLDNVAIQYPHVEKERVPFGRLSLVDRISKYSRLIINESCLAWLVAYAGGIPLISLLAWTSIGKTGGHKIHVTFLGLLIRSVSISSLDQ